MFAELPSTNDAQTVLVAAIAGILAGLIPVMVSAISTQRLTKKTSFINTVTSERVKWIGKLRENISNLCARCERVAMGDRSEDALQETERIKFEVRLQLNATEDQNLDRLMTALPDRFVTMDMDKWRALRNELLIATRAALKREWEKVKDESLHGDLRRSRQGPFGTRAG